jgi:Metallo-beta-lactamase superfamily
LDDKRRARLSDRPNAQRKLAQIFGETGYNQILARFLLLKSPTKSLNVLYCPFRAVTPSSISSAVAISVSRSSTCAPTWHTLAYGVSNDGTFTVYMPQGVLPMAVKRVIKGVHVVPMGMANAFLIEGDDGLTLIDAGYPGKEAAVFGAIRGLGRSPDQLKHLIFTHGHPDHIGSAAAIVRETGARTYMHPLDIPMAESGGPIRRCRLRPRPRFQRRLLVPPRSHQKPAVPNSPTIRAVPVVKV